MNRLRRPKVKSAIVISAYLVGLTLISFSSVRAQVAPQGRTIPRAGVIQPQLPDLEAKFVMSGWEDEVFHVEVTFQNRGNAKFESANVNAPFKVWLRIWKPTDAKSAEGPTSGKNSFLWGGVVTVNELIRPAQLKKVRFTPSTAPPGGWRMSCSPMVGCFRTPESLKDPLRWRVAVEVDSTNAIKESNETNNHYQ